MSASDPLLRIPLLYHFTDTRNLPLIQQLGGLLPMAELVRRKMQIPAPGGNQWSRDADAMSAWIDTCTSVSETTTRWRILRDRMAV